MSLNLWHDVSLGDNAPKEINVIVEIPKGSKNKYEIDKETGLIALDRALHTAQDYPFDYGFVPQTLWDDGDALDVVLLTTYPLFPGILVNARPIAIMHMTDAGEGDDKVIAVPVGDPRWADINDLNDINKHTLKEMEHFFTTYKKIQNKIVEVSGFEGAKEAREAVTKSIELYKKEFGK
ncbi:MAG TPA: inorganic pyrophosphatase [Candidatus Yonathbacteria bacterium]|nr:inorganic pyrophosphatase [Candidatus Yonathbacteria bacterium]